MPGPEQLGIFPEELYSSVIESTLIEVLGSNRPAIPESERIRQEEARPIGKGAISGAMDSLVFSEPGLD